MVSWNVSVGVSGLRSRPVGIIFAGKVDVNEDKEIFLEKNKKCLMVVSSLIKML